MKRLLIIVSVLLVIWLLLLPGLVGVYLRGALPLWLEEANDGMAPPPVVDYRIGWFGSRLEAQTADGLEVRIQARHLPPGRAAWLSLDGELQAPISDQPIALRGQIGLAGASDFQLDAAALRLDEPFPLQVQSGQLALRRSGTSLLSLSLQEPVFGDPTRQPLSYPLTEARLEWRALADDKGDLQMALAAGDGGPDDLRLLLSARSVALAPAAELLAAQQQLQAAEPDSFDQRMALLGLAGAWQQLAAAGLVIELEALDLGAESRIEGRWQTDSGGPVVSGSGLMGELERSLLPIITLAHGGDRLGALIWLADSLDELSRRGWLSYDDTAFELIYSPTPTPAAP